MAVPFQYYNNPPAYMGFVGYVRFLPGPYNTSPMIVRATSADISLKQTINKPDVIDSRYDRTVYQLGPMEVDGSISFPAVYDAAGGSNIVTALYKYAVSRSNDGLLSSFDMDVKYASSKTTPNEADFTYGGCIANSFKFAVTQQDVVTITTDIIGLNRLAKDLSGKFNFNPATSGYNTALENTRVVTWNDVRCEIRQGSQRGAFNFIGGQFVRSLEVNINNNAERFYTLNKQLYAQAIAPTKRDVMGNLVLMGRHKDLANLALENQYYAYEDTKLAFGFTPMVSSSSANQFSVELPNVVFQIEEMALTNNLFETTINWHSLPAAGTLLNGSDPLLATLNEVVWHY